MWLPSSGETRHEHAKVIDFSNGRDAEGKPNNRFLAVRELKLQGLRVPHYNTRAGGTRKIIARNHQVLGVNNAVAAVRKQEELKTRYPERQIERTVYRMIPER